MLEKIPTPYSVNAADAADRLRLIATDLRLIAFPLEFDDERAAWNLSSLLGVGHGRPVTV